MPNAALNAYLAKNYLQGAKAEALLARSGQSDGEKKKRKKKQHRVDGEEEASGSRSGQGLRLVDENDDSWAQRGASDEEAVVVEDDSVGARKKRSKWNKLGSDLLPEEQIDEPGDEDERPQMAGEDGLGLDSGAQDAVEEQLKRQQQQASSSSSSKSMDKTKPAIRAGLKTKEEMRAERLERERLAARQDTQLAEEIVKAEEEREAERRRKEREERAQETVYRDASGRKIDVRRDDEERRLAREEEVRREREKKDWNKGQVQLERVREARRREEEERTTDFARYSTDERMNKQLRDIQREADPALNFLTKKQKSSGPQKPSYKGSFPPNRFRIRPGYRWDGVERSNGFEVKYFQRKHQRAHRQEEMDAWGKEDM